MLFLSTPIKLTFETKLLNAVLENNDLMKASLFALCINAVLSIVFILQHSCMKSELVKRFWTKIGLESAERSIYNIVSALTLVVSIRNLIGTSFYYPRVFMFLFSSCSTTGSLHPSLHCGTLMSAKKPTAGGRWSFFMACYGSLSTVVQSFWTLLNCWVSNRFTTTSMIWLRLYPTNLWN
jgi:hypothetical protein